ncbi:FCD domain-containing protein, partial [Rhodococcus sp. T2V]
YDVRRLLEVEAARLGAQRISAEDCDRMQAEFTLMRAAVDEGRVVALLDHDEALLSILYEAAANPVLLQTIRNLWNHCRAYKIVGAQGSLDSGGDDPLWRFQERLVAAARDRSGESAAAVNEESLLDATDRIKALLATEQAASADAG